MKKLIVVRHGRDAGYPGSLTPEGIRSVEALSEKLKAHINGLRSTIISSTKPRAVETTEILAMLLAINSIKHHHLLGYWVDLATTGRDVIALIKSCETEFDVIILSTHLEFAQIIPATYARDVLGVKLAAPNEVLNAEAVLLDCEHQSITLIK